ncbi:MAG: hypothetical protein AB7F66_10955 [Bacteriovoracia bacterium]
MDEQYKGQSLEDFIDYARRNLLNNLQSAYGHTDSWPFIRSRVLQIFGRTGLGRYTQTPNKEKSDVTEKYENQNQPD